jgi:hypothetical protein
MPTPLDPLAYHNPAQPHPAVDRPRDWVAKTLSWYAFVLLVLVAGFFASFVPRFRDQMTAIYLDFGPKLTSAADLAANVPTVLLFALPVLVVSVTLVLQLGHPSKRTAAVAHLLGIFTLALLFLAYRERLGSPLASMLQTMTGGGGKS